MHNLLLTIILTLITTPILAMDNIMTEAQNKVKISTSMGDIIIQLDPKKAPVSTANFLTYVAEGFYDGTIFHRIIPDFMAQGGGFDTDFKQKQTHAPIKNEANNGLKNKLGTVAMARASAINSATAQFFINYKDNSFLDYIDATPEKYGYAVFAVVVSGIEVLEAMAKVKTENRQGHQNVPKVNIVINKVSLMQ